VQADLEEQDEDADLGEGSDYRVRRIDDGKRRPAENHARDQFAKHTGLAKALRESAKQLRRDDQGDQNTQEMGERMPRRLLNEGEPPRRDQRAASPSR
jgi:hypothetical protein